MTSQNLKTALLLLVWSGTIPLWLLGASLFRDAVVFCVGLTAKVTHRSVAVEPTSEVVLNVNLPTDDVEAGASGDPRVVTVEYFDNVGGSKTLTATFTPTVPAVGNPRSNEWTLTLTPTPKIADHIRAWGGVGPYVTFKAAAPETPEADMIDIARRQRDRTRCDLVFANVLGRIGEALARILHEDPCAELPKELDSFKHLVEGESSAATA